MSHMHLPRVCLAVSLTVWLCALVLLSGCDAPTRAVYITSGCADPVPTAHLTMHSERAAQYRLTYFGNFGTHADVPEYHSGGDSYIKRRPRLSDVTDVSVETRQDDATWQQTDYLQLERCE